MSRDWTQAELKAASVAMKAAGHMSYEEVCAELNAIEKINKLAPMQEKSHWPCPRCGCWEMDRVMVRNALSRRIHIFICSDCGGAEALEDFLGEQIPLASWHIAQFEDWPLDDEAEYMKWRANHREPREVEQEGGENVPR